MHTHTHKENYIYIHTYIHIHIYCGLNSAAHFYHTYINTTTHTYTCCTLNSVASSDIISICSCKSLRPNLAERTGSSCSVIWICAYACAYTYTYVRVFGRAREPILPKHMYMYMYTCMHIYIYIHTHAHTHIHIRMHTHSSMEHQATLNQSSYRLFVKPSHVSMYVCIYKYIHIHIYTHIYTHTCILTAAWDTKSLFTIVVTGSLNPSNERKNLTGSKGIMSHTPCIHVCTYVCMYVWYISAVIKPSNWAQNCH